MTKVLFDEGSGRVIGCGIVGPSAGDLIAEAALAIEMGADAAWPPGRPGAAWQRAALAVAGPGRSPEQALAAMLDRYVCCAATGQPVHSWPVAS